ncbi:undecaprenyl-diphosphate phosphatase [Xylocopilactobacillus apicola]|uniref:Undecaprenyl-diphosphatase n=1 Tax=Xylocopilactobacillus apicola TaxID=2932184 RepID=A0AAU9DXK3_9LACO|nr:undecaprenyl-diphosphate phosphatase [Xylocopilactobacillus apicola]BDR58848.1 undecaprenyl-diphosphatase [Xylocopilactobacillus apicola]
MIHILQAVIIGIIEGITEFLPISSTGHIVLAENLMKIPTTVDPNAKIVAFDANFWTMFSYVIQLGAIFAVIFIYFNRLNPFSGKKDRQQKHDTWQLWFYVVVGVIPSVVVGLPLNDWMDEHLMNWQVVSATLIIYGILFIVIENWNRTRQIRRTKLHNMTYGLALSIGCFQALSIVPGTSRSGATILGALILGMSRMAATEFSFFLAIPTMFGVTILKLGKFFLKGATMSGLELTTLLVGFVVSMIVAWFAVVFLMNYLKKHNFKVFGVYRIILGFVVIIAGAFFKLF